MEKYALKWSNYKENSAAAFTSLWTEDEFKDITLVSQDGHQIEAHKVVLSSSSGFFKNLFARNRSRNHALVYLKEMNFKELEAIIKFIYIGEAEVEQESLEEFLKTGMELKIKGLGDSKNENKSEVNTTESNDIVNKQTDDFIRTECGITKEKLDEEPWNQPTKYSPPLNNFLSANDTETIEQFVEISDNKYNCEYCPFSTMKEKHMKKHMSCEHPNTEDFGTKIELFTNDEALEMAMSMKSPDELFKFVSNNKGSPKSYSCIICNEFKVARKSHVRDHLESKHFKGVFSYLCQVCNKKLAGRNALAVHTTQQHPKVLIHVTKN